MATEVEPMVGSFKIGDRVRIRPGKMLTRFRRLVVFTWGGKDKEKLTDGAKQLWQADIDLGRARECVIRAKADLPDCVFITINGFEYPSAISISWFEPVPQ